MVGNKGVEEFMQIKSIYPDWEGIGSSIMKNLLLSGGDTE